MARFVTRVAFGGGQLPPGPPPPPTLQPLVPSAAFKAGTAVSGTLSGATAGSSVACNIPGVTLSGLSYSGTPTSAAGTLIPNAFVETLAGATNSPNPTAVTVASAVTPLPSGIVAMWDAASLSSLANGANVTSWTDSVGGDVATTTGGTPHTYIANYNGLPGVQLSKADVLASSSSGAAANASATGEFGVIVVASNIQDGDGNPCLVAVGTGTGALLQANATQTGRYQVMYPCATAGMRTIGMTNSASKGINLMSINGTTFVDSVAGSGQFFIGGWKAANTVCCGKAIIHTVIVLNRPATAADFKQVHRRYCELLGQTRPGGASARHVTAVGDSLTAGYLAGGFTGSFIYQMAQALGWEWGTWDNMGVPGWQWLGDSSVGGILARTVPLLGNISAATGTRNIMPLWEYYNERSNPGATIAQHAQTVITALHNQDPNREILLGTSTDAGSASGVSNRQTRRDYDAALIAGLTGVTTLVRLDLDPNIGVEGAAPTAFGSGNAYYADSPTDNTDFGIHFKVAGQALLDNGPYGFRPAVQARLAA